eukprot:gene2776-12653_t
MYAQEEYAINIHRLRESGVKGTHPARLDHALCPIPDKPFLECIAKLPKPGDSLASQPESVPQPKKKRAKSAKKKKAK